jgi:hypothetical protein
MAVLISESPFLGVKPRRLAKSQTRAFVTIKGKLVPFDRGTKLDFSAVARIVKEIRYQQPIFLYGKDIIEPNHKQNVVCDSNGLIGYRLFQLPTACTLTSH